MGKSNFEKIYEKADELVKGLCVMFFCDSGNPVTYGENMRVPFDIYEIRNTVVMLYLQKWMENDNNSTETVNSYAVKAFERYEENILSQNSYQNEEYIDQANYIRNFYRKFDELAQIFSMYEDYAKRNNLVYKEIVRKENNRLKESYVDLALTELLQNGYLYLFEALIRYDDVLKTKGTAKNETIRNGYNQYNKLYEFIRGRQDAKEYVAFCCALYKIERAYRFDMIEKTAKEIVANNIPKDADFTDIMSIFFFGINNMDFIQILAMYLKEYTYKLRTISPNSTMKNMNILGIDKATDLAIEILNPKKCDLEIFKIKKYAFFKNIMIHNYAFSTLFTIMPTVDQPSMTEEDYKAAVHFLKNEYKIVEGHIPAGTEYTKETEEKFDCIRNIYTQSCEGNCDFQQAREILNCRNKNR